MEFLSGQWICLPVLTYYIWVAKKTLGNKRTILFLLFLGLTLASCDVMSSYIFKNVFTRLRPCRDESLKNLIYDFGQRCGGKFGFISSHASNSIALVTFGLITLNLKKHWWILLLPLLVGYSRIYLAVHYPGDVLAGFLVGLGFAYLYAKLFIQARAQVD